ncbi:hypothetical protein EV702DRAFT_1194459 [Suillus placidus]|uniref:Uncharacterized protein n=1 Tax=Suillus placidus TaxID=48579 RepID=A0A9P7A211_9AGAM|nr:hypothetical protein EV702DRAFT_1194459 [Suillus placidus]
MKQSTQCRTQLLLGTEATLTSAPTATTSRSKDMRMQDEIAALLPWADAINSKYPYALTDGTLKVASTPSAHPSTTGDSTSSLWHSADALFEDAIIQSIGTRLVGIVQDALLQPGARSTSTHAGVDKNPAIAVSKDAVSAVPPPPPPPMPEPASDKLRVVTLRDGTILKLADAEIPDPPAISFVNNISWLNSMRDDHTAHWRGESVMNI